VATVGAIVSEDVRIRSQPFTGNLVNREYDPAYEAR
jgi:hypothetical protein